MRTDGSRGATRAEIDLGRTGGERADSYRCQAFVLLLLTGIALVYGQTMGFQFMAYDDIPYVLDNPNVVRGLTWAGLREAFTGLVMTHWHPLTEVSHMLDVELFGLSPGAHHGVNLALHAANSILLFSFLTTATKAFWPAAFVATVFAVHPLRAENVAWIADRKDLLCAFFGFLSLHAYARYVARRRLRWYGLTLILLCFGLLSKSMLVTLPIMCLLLDVWPFRRLGGGLYRPSGDNAGWNRYGPWQVPECRTQVWALLAEKIPLVAVALGVGVVTCVAFEATDKVDAYFGRVSFPLRLSNAVCSYAWYIVKTAWPTGLHTYYIHPNLPGGAPWQVWQILGGVLLLGAVSWLVWWCRRPYLLIGWLWFLATLAPVSGLLQIGNHSRADHYVYIPTIGLLIMVAWGADELLRHSGVLAKGVTRYVVVASAAGAVSVLGIATYVQVGHWKDSMTFHEYQLSCAPNHPFFLTNMAVDLVVAGRHQEAIEYGERALAIWPGLLEAHLVLERAYRDGGNPQLARYHRQQGYAIKSAVSRKYGKLTADRDRGSH